MPPADPIEPSAIDAESGMGVIADDLCLELLDETPIGRIAFTVDDHPMVVPVNYAWFEDTVVFRTLQGQKLEAAAQGQRVCFQIDQWSSADRSGWSVAVVGQAREVTDFAEREQLENVGVVPWTKAKWRQSWIRIEPETISGRVLR